MTGLTSSGLTGSCKPSALMQHDGGVSSFCTGGWVASAVFMLHKLSPTLLITFLLWQGDPLAMLLFIFHLQPLFYVLHHVLTGFSLGILFEAALGYVDKVAALSTSIVDLEVLDTTVTNFKAVFGALLNRQLKVCDCRACFLGQPPSHFCGSVLRRKSKSMVWWCPPLLL
jgi:hypothetical protein